MGNSERPLPPLLLKLESCGNADDWAEGFEVGKLAWEACPKGSWIAWFAAAVQVASPVIIGALQQCARAVDEIEAQYPGRPMGARIAKWAVETARAASVRIEPVTASRDADPEYLLRLEKALRLAFAECAALAAHRAEDMLGDHVVASIIREHIPYAVIAAALERHHGYEP